MRAAYKRWLIYAAALLVLLGVFAMYVQPDFMRTLADQIWACF